MIDVDEVVREVLVEVTGKLPETLGNVAFPVLLVASEIVIDTVANTLELLTKRFR